PAAWILGLPARRGVGDGEVPVEREAIPAAVLETIREPGEVAALIAGQREPESVGCNHLDEPAGRGPDTEVDAGRAGLGPDGGPTLHGESCLAVGVVVAGHL